MTQNQLNLRAFQFSVVITIERINLSINFPCKLQIQWKRGNQKLETIGTPNLDKGVANFGNEKLQIQSNMYLDEQKKLFREKKSTFTIVLITPKGNKVAGTCQLELSNYLNQNKNSFDETLKLEKCPDRNAILKLKLELFLIKEIDIETISQMSIASKADSFEDKSVTKQAPEISNVPDLSKPTPHTSKSTVASDSVLQRDNEKLKKQVEDLTQSSQTKVEEINRYMREISELRSSKDVVINNLNAMLQDRKDVGNSQLEQDYLKLNKQHAILQKQLSSFEKEISQYETTIAQQKSQIAALTQNSTKIISLQEQLDQRDKQYKIVLEENLSLKQESTKFVPALIGLSTTNDEVNQLKELLKKSQKNESQNRDQLSKQSTKLQDQITISQKLQQQLEEEQRKSTTVSSSSKQQNEYEKQIKLLKKSLQDQNAQYISATEQLIQAKCQLGDVFNAAFTIGGPKLVDNLQTSVGIRERN